MKVRRKEIFDATQWFKVGDHSMVEEIPPGLKHYIPAINGAKGFFSLPSNGPRLGTFVFEGDYIITENVDNIYVISSDEFKDKFEIIEE